jgi:hypothetical protein
MDRARNKGGSCIRECVEENTAAIFHKVWPESSRSAADISRQLALEAFITSPPVRAAFWLFREHTKTMLSVSEDRIRTEIAMIRPEIDVIIADPSKTETRRLIHQYIAPNQKHPSNEWVLKDFLLSFLVRAEMWRQYELRWIPSWDFGSNDKNVLVLLETLISLWIMHEDGCFGSIRIQEDWMQFQAWDNWLIQYGAGLSLDILPLSGDMRTPHGRSAIGQKEDEDRFKELGELRNTEQPKRLETETSRQSSHLQG